MNKQPKQGGHVLGRAGEHPCQREVGEEEDVLAQQLYFLSWLCHPLPRSQLLLSGRLEDRSVLWSWSWSHHYCRFPD